MVRACSGILANRLTRACRGGRQPVPGDQVRSAANSPTTASGPADPSRARCNRGTGGYDRQADLFVSGYGVGFEGKPLHAGFLGQDVLIVHDEAHLSRGSGVARKNDYEMSQRKN